MSLKKIAGCLFPAVDSDRRKQMVDDLVESMPQSNDGVVNIHRDNPNNVGDYFCAPHHYFKELHGTKLDISDYRDFNARKRKEWAAVISAKSLIVGGGGLLNIPHFERQLKLVESLADRGKKTVIWGAGHNELDASKFGEITRYNIDVAKFGLVGTRDFSMQTDWVPCVSCLNPIFDRQFVEKHETGIVFSKNAFKDKQLLQRLAHYPTSSNTTNLEEMIGFIGASSAVVTDSYHAMYWAILLGKRTVVIPTTSKFYDFKYPSTISTYEDFENELSHAQSYSGVLEECRAINHNFAQRVFDYLNL